MCKKSQERQLIFLKPCAPSINSESLKKSFCTYNDFILL